MTLTIDLPDDLEQRLRREVGDLDRAAKESLLAGFYGEGRITHAELGRALGVSRFEVDAVIKRHKVGQELSLEELRRDAAALPAPRRSEDQNGSCCQ